MRIRKLQTFAAVIALVAIASTPGVASANEGLMSLSNNPNNWAMWGGTYDGAQGSDEPAG